MTIEVFPVVHVGSEAQATEQAAIALEAGADGIYLIDHHSRNDTDLLINCFNKVGEQNPDAFVGLNFLQHDVPYQSFIFLLYAYSEGDIRTLPSGLWADDADPDHDRTRTTRHTIPELSQVQYLGGVSFKYTHFFSDEPEPSAKEAERLMDAVDVVTTSGRGTGYAPNPAKIKAMKDAIGSKKLAVASGISINNLTDYAGNFDQLVVSSSIETESYSGIFVPRKVKDLVDLAHSL